MSFVYDFSANDLSGQLVSLSAYQDKVLLIVNTASQCGFTSQYHGLQRLFDHLKDQGLVVLGFPCNQFGHQEPGSAVEIGAFCEQNYRVTFPLFEKIDVNGANAHPLFQYLKQQAPGFLGSEAIKWNFTKFLVRRDGTVFSRYASITKPEELLDDIKKLLAEKTS